VILYLHGFTSGPQSFKARALQERMSARGQADRFVCPQLPASPAQAIALAERIIEEKVSHGGTPPAVVGSSLGGYYATHLAEEHGLKAVLVNPVVAGQVDPALFIGPQRFIHTGEEFDFTAAHVEELRALDMPAITQPKRYWLLVETGDETLDHHHAVTRYAGARQTVLIGGDHSFTRWTDYLDDIVDFCS
jgi:predicted esterase YcpF (UPF0227 family)